MRRGLVALLLLLQGATATAEETNGAGTGIRPFLALESMNYGGPVSIHDALDDLETAGIGSGESAFTHSEVEVGAHWNSWSVSALYRLDWNLRFSEDLADLAFRQVNDVPIPDGRVFDLSLGAEQLEGFGIRLARSWRPTDWLSFTPRLTVLRTVASLDGSAVGSVSVANGRYQGSAEIAQRYTEDYLLDRRVGGSNGWGVTADLALELRPSESTSIAVAVEDAFTHFVWEDLPRTRARVDSRSAALDADGNLVVRPTLSGVEDFDDHAQELPRRIRVDGRWQYDARYSLWARHLRIAGEPFTRLGVSYTTERAGRWSVGADLDAQALLLGLASRRWSVELTVDSFDHGEAALVDLAFAVSL